MNVNKDNLVSVEDFSVDTLNKIRDYIDNPQYDQIILNDNEVIKKTYDRKSDDLGNFQAIGKINFMGTTKHSKTDIFDLLGKVKKATYTLFLELKDKRDPITNATSYDTTAYTKSQLTVFSRKIVELKKQELLKKMGKQGYMINPYLIKPFEYNAAITIWKKL